MRRRKTHSFIITMIFLSIGGLFINSDSSNRDFSDKVKVALREAANSVLLLSGDSSTVIKPILEQENSTFKIEFSDSVFFDPADVPSFITSSLEKMNLDLNYRVSVKECLDNETYYSYELVDSTSRDMITCRGRILPEKCYSIFVQFTKRKIYGTPLSAIHFVIIGLLLIGSILLLFFLFRKKKNSDENEEIEGTIKIGAFNFYPEQSKLVRQEIEKNLSNKECELLIVFADRPNQIIKREELTKKVWEDNGVFVGRSLDTYVSKLRKKLSSDDSIRITNVHGIGYKLEVD